MINKIPFAHVFFPLLKGIFNALAICNQISRKKVLIKRKNLINELYRDHVRGVAEINKRNKKKQKTESRKSFIEKCCVLREDNPLLINCFKEISQNIQQGFNKFLYEGLVKSHQDDRRFPRLVKITIEAYRNAQKLKTDQRATGILPSPLFILYHALIDPDEPQTSAYSLTACRAMLFRFTGLHPEVPILRNFKYPLDSKSESFQNYRPFDENDIHNSMSSFRRHAKIYLRWPKDSEKKDSREEQALNILVGNMLGLKGIVHLWFKDENELAEFCEIKKIASAEYFSQKFSNGNLKFRLSYYHTDLPDTGEIVNILFGIPLPIRGADVVFSGALKKSANTGLVISLSGEPGVGKTSVALSLAALFYPLGTRCIYISLEEGEKDLKKRLLTLVPDYIKEIMFIEGERPFRKRNFINDWFDVYEIKDNLTLQGFKSMLERIEKENERMVISVNSIPAINPLYIVIDNINELLAEYKETNESFSLLEQFVDVCRSLGAIVVLISAEEIHKNIKLEYLVDVVSKIKHSSTDRAEEKPVRLFQLTKTRHQASRPGAHVIHLAGSSGFRLSPQIPSQMDKKEKLRKLGYDPNKYLNTLNLVEIVSRNSTNDKLKVRSTASFSFLFEKETHRKKMLEDEIHKTDPNEKTKVERLNQLLKMQIISLNNIEYILKRSLPFLNIYINTQILIHGYGSSGKAGLALKLLLTPPSSTFLNSDKSLSVESRRKVLIISFLYSEDYYDELIKNNIIPIISQAYPNNIKAKHFTKTFYPGYLRAEDLINKITRLLDGGILEGEPYTGILLDGLHNVFLQFKELQKNDMVWPLLYSILSRYELTVVSTFTNFSLSDRLIDSGNRGQGGQYNNSIPDHVLLQQGQTPFLHGLVKASDYYFQLSEEISTLNKRRYLLSVKSSITQTPPRFLLEWDRDNAVFKDIHLPEIINEVNFFDEFSLV